MHLRQRQHQKKLLLDASIKSSNLDIAILNTISQQNNFPLTSDLKIKPSTMSLNNLSSILKNKNEKFQKYRHEQQSTREWLKDKGVDIRKINEEIRDNVRLAQQMPTIIKTKTQDFLRPTTSLLTQKSQLPSSVPLTINRDQRILEFTPQIQLDFIRKQRDNALSSILMKSLNNPKSRNTTKYALINKIRRQSTMSFRNPSANLNNSKYPTQRIPTFIQQSQQAKSLINQKKRNLYFKFVQSLVTSGFEQSIGLLKQISPFWKIVIQHIKTIQHYQPKFKPTQSKIQNSKDNQDDTKIYQQKMNAFLMMKSLKLIQKEYSKSLASDNVDNLMTKIQFWVKKMENKNKKLKVWRNSNGEPIWAVAFILFKAGRMTQFKRTLQSVDRELVQDFVRYQETVDRQYPQPSPKRYDLHKYKDNFYNQLIYILKAKTKYDSQVIENQHLDTAWIFLRTLGIYRNMPDLESQYSQILESMFQYEADTNVNSLNSQKILKYLYLGGYKHLIQLCQLLISRKQFHLFSQSQSQSNFNFDDYFHLLTILNYYPELWGNTSERQRQILEQKYSQTLLEYLNKLRREQTREMEMQNCSSYLLLAPIQYIKQVACQFIKTQEEFQKFNWKRLKELMVERDEIEGERMFLYLERKVWESLRGRIMNDYKIREIENTNYRSSTLTYHS